MTMPNTLTMFNALQQSLSEIDMQIKHVKNDILREYPKEEHDKINVWYWTRYGDGKYVLEALLVARAELIAAMATLKAADIMSKIPQPRKR